MPSADAIAADWASASNSQRALIQSMGLNPTITGFSATPSQAILEANPGFPSAGSNPLTSPFGPVIYSPTTNYIQPPSGDSSGMTSDGGLNIYLIIGLLAVAAFAIFMVVK